MSDMRITTFGLERGSAQFHFCHQQSWFKYFSPVLAHVFILISKKASTAVIHIEK